MPNIKEKVSSCEAPLQEVAHVCVDVLIGGAAQPVILVCVPLEEDEDILIHILVHIIQRGLFLIIMMSSFLYMMTFDSTVILRQDFQMTHHRLKVHLLLHQSFRDRSRLLEVNVVCKHKNKYLQYPSLAIRTEEIQHRCCVETDINICGLDERDWWPANHRTDIQGQHRVFS